VGERGWGEGTPEAQHPHSHRPSPSLLYHPPSSQRRPEALHAAPSKQHHTTLHLHALPTPTLHPPQACIIANASAILSFPRGCPGFDGGSEIAWCMPRGQLSSLIQPQTYSCQRRQLRSGRLRPSPEPTCACASGCRVIITGSPKAAACRPGLNQAGWSFDALRTLCCRGMRSNRELSM
jgi:hypothetical protein